MTVLNQKGKQFPRTEIHILAILSLSVAVIGCGGGGKSTAEVKGTVTLDGKPLVGAACVNFEPVSGGKMASGIVAADGSFILKTYKDGDGAVVGKHQVSVRPIPAFVPDDAPAGREADISPIPTRYRSTQGSGLEYDVESGLTNEFQLELKTGHPTEKERIR